MPCLRRSGTTYRMKMRYHHGMTPAQIRSIRKKLEDFASRLGFTGEDRRITVWRWENGRRQPSQQTFMPIRTTRAP
jgi:DNA-binding transcriptional regulator YiaG